MLSVILGFGLIYISPCSSTKKGKGKENILLLELKKFGNVNVMIDFSSLF